MKHFENVKKDFINKLIENIEDRFPRDQLNIISAFAALGMRPISFIDKDQLGEWGDDKLQVLLEHYGVEQSKGDETVPPLIDTDKTKKEWAQIKTLVLSCAYPRDKLSNLWSLINAYHADMFPNLLKLASVALVLPVHTADCERGFSGQNRLKTPLRNRMSAEKMDTQMVILLEGPSMETFPFEEAVSSWKQVKQRKLYQQKLNH